MLRLESLELKPSLHKDGFDWQTAMSEQNGSSLTATLKKEAVEPKSEYYGEKR